ncbi:MAG: hypothetical protein H6614_09260 [Ignavibacteriales bacterium]|nr:hypothetical protein [Ignavibacteriales bacterium]
MIKRLIIMVTLLFAIVASGYMTFNRASFYCMLAEAMYMHRIGDNVYISPGSSDAQIELCRELVATAESRNTELWGSVQSRPVFIFCTDWDDYYNFGMYRTQAMTRMNFAGEYIVISPFGMNSDDVSHEMCHAELYSRVGYENDKKIPLWFHEGLAMILCKEYPQSYTDYLTEWNNMTKSTPEMLPLDRISSDEDFYSSPSRSNLAYWRSGMEVTRWFEISGRKGLVKMMNHLNGGWDFYTAYKKAEEIY